MCKPPLAFLLALTCGALAACTDTEFAEPDLAVDSRAPDLGAKLDSGAWPDQVRLGDGGTKVWKLYAHDRTTLLEIDPLTLNTSNPKVTKIGDFSFESTIPANEQSINDIAVTPDNKIYVVSKTYLYQVDPQSAALTKVTELRDKQNQYPPPLVALTFETSGQLLASDMDGALIRIHYTGAQKGLVEEIGSYGQGQGSSGDLVAIGDGTVYGVSQKGAGATYDDNMLLRVDPTTGVATPVGAIGYGYVWGLAYWGGEIYGFTNEKSTLRGQLLKIDPKTGKGRSVVEYPFLPYAFWGAAVNPMVPVK